MYLIPIVLIALLAVIATAWSPIFAVVLFVFGFAVFLAYVATRPRADEQLAPPERPGRQPHHDDDTPTGIWGERRPS